MKFGIIQFPGSTDHKDLFYIINEIIEQEAFYIWHKDTDLKKADAILVTGKGLNGISETPSELQKKSPVLAQIKKFVRNGGFVFGIGSGFGLLCAAGLLPGKLVMNANSRFCCKNVFIKPAHIHSSLTALLDTNMAYKVPVSCLYGQYYADDETLRSLRENKQILFHYCDKDGSLTELANPNGSIGNIAGICNKEKNVYGMVPHPERASDDELGNTDGRAIFESVIAYLK
jgi:phosphoribosylformylglycinamidine synthase subunit PurQ / glutaminase